ncbi:MAG: hypothetical protein NVSMB38_18020 [Ktedonobacteraceae bacterium]
MVQSADRQLVCAIDIGGTFTDCVLVDSQGRLGYGKALSSPGDDFQSGFFGSIEAAAEHLGYSNKQVFEEITRVISHGSTVATNSVVEGKGATVGLLTTKGHEATLLMMRGLGRVTGEPPENVLKVTETFKPKPLVPHERIKGITERVDFAGNVVVLLDEAELGKAVHELLEAGCDAIAISFLWSIQHPDHELRAAELVRQIAPDVFVSVSHEISTAVGEYERTVAAVINAFVGLKTSHYLGKLEQHLNERGFGQDLLVMQSHGGMVPLEDGTRMPVLTVGSGPVGGLIGTQHIAEELAMKNIIATDMGGTSFDVGIIRDGEPLSAEETVIGKYRYKIPAVEVLSIGAGGGSIGWIDPHSRTLRVGPQSAGSDPGPACYGGHGGIYPTVTDANLVLGYIDPDAVFGTMKTGQIKPNRQLAERAIRQIAEPLGLSVTDTALGIVEIVNSKMANLLENVIVGRGFDPRDFVALSYGGSGPLHAAGYASELGISTIIIPGEVASVWSAFGIAMSDIRYQLERDIALLSPFDPSLIEQGFMQLQQQAEARLKQVRDGENAEFRRYVRMRYQWQRHELEVRLPDGELNEVAISALTSDFKRRYEERYGSAALLSEARFEIVSLRLEPIVSIGVAPRARTVAFDSGEAQKASRVVYFQRGQEPQETAVYNGALLKRGVTVNGTIIENLAVSPITLETRDFQTAILAEDGEILFFGPYLQYMSGMLDVMARYILEHKGALVRDGDMWLQNDPWVGTAHQPDVGLLCPVFYEGQLFCWVTNCAHQNDVGGTVPGSFCPNAKDVYYDPPLFPPFRIVRNGEIDEELESIYRRQSRTPINLALDLRATIAGNHVARQRILRLISKYGADTVKGVMRGILNTSQAAFRSTLATIPDGTWSERCYQEVAVAGDRGAYRVQLTIHKEGDQILIDNSSL